MTDSAANRAQARHLLFHGQPAIEIVAPDGACALISLFGAQLLSWKPAGGAERLYLSERAVFDGCTALRGGVPVIFPQFAARGSGPRHGFARTRSWQLDAMRVGEDFATATLRLASDAATLAQWPHAFVLELTVVVSGARIDIEMDIENTGAEACEFSCALHTYLRVAEVENVSLEGLQGKRYLDATRGEALTQDRHESLVVDDEVDRIYLDAPDMLLLREPQRALGIYSEGFPEVVVWNPWELKCRALLDMPDSDFRRMLCVEAAAAHRVQRLTAGEHWVGRQSLIAG